MIHTEKLTRTFGSGKDTVEAVRGVDLDVGAGELVAFLGPNGAGKSTTLRMLTSLLSPTSGIRPRGRRRRHGPPGRGALAHRLHRAEGRRRVQLPRARRAPHAGPLLRSEPRRVGPAWIEPAGQSRPGRHGDAQGLDAVRRAEAPPRHRPRTHPRAVAPVPRRAVDGHGSAEPGEPVGAHHAAARGARHHDRAHHALSRGGRHDGRTGRRHRPRSHHRRRHGRRAQGRTGR